MNRIDSAFQHLRSTARKGLISFVTAGDPSPGLTVPLLRTLVAAGVDILELGVPYSDPRADGPVIQRASEWAGKQGIVRSRVLEMVQTFRQADSETPIILMGYANPIESIGTERFSKWAREAGVDGVLVVDMPLEEGRQWFTPLRERGVAPIPLVAPTTSEARLASVLELGRGFIYYVSMAGVTGAEGLDIGAVRTHVDAIRQLTALPIGVGFGVKDADSAAAVATVADAVVIGSAIVRTLEAHRERPDPETLQTALYTQVRTLRTGVDQSAALDQER